MESSVNVTCPEIQISDGFELRVSAGRFSLLHQSDCEPLWYSQDGRLLADPSDPQKLIDPVISVSSDRLVTSHCVIELHHEIHCITSGLRLKTIFRARNETAVTPNSDDLNESLQLSDQWCWISVLIFIVLLGLICFLLRKKIFRCLQQTAPRVCEHNDPENRVNQTVLKASESDDEMLMKVRSDAPHSPQDSEQFSSSCPEDHQN